MPDTYVQLPDGSYAQFPEGTPTEAMESAVKSHIAAKATAAMAPPKTHYDAQGKPYITDDPNDVQEPTPMKDAAFAGVQALANDPLAAMTADLKMPSMVIEGLAKAGPLVKGAMQAAKRITLPVRNAAGGALRTTGSLMESPLANVVLGPRMEHMGKLITAAGDAVSPVADVAPKLAPGVRVPESVDAMMARASRIKTAPPARLEGGDVAAGGGDAADALAAMRRKPTDLRTFLNKGKPPEPSPNAGGVLKSGAPRPSLEEMIAQSLQEKAGAPSTQMAPPQTLTPTGRPAIRGNDPANLPASERPLNMPGRSVSMPGREPFVSPMMEGAAKATEIPSASTLLDTLNAPEAATASPLRQQLLQSLAERLPSQSKTGMSSIPGLTEADIAVIEKAMRDARAARHAEHYSNAVSEAAAKRSVARGK